MCVVSRNQKGARAHEHSSDHTAAWRVHRAAIARQEQVVIHATMCDLLTALAAEQITESQALTMLILLAERVSTSAPDQAAVYRATIDAIHQMQAEEH